MNNMVGVFQQQNVYFYYFPISYFYDNYFKINNLYNKY